jgi:hypothetical protein
LQDYPTFFCFFSLFTTSHAPYLLLWLL